MGWLCSYRGRWISTSTMQKEYLIEYRGCRYLPIGVFFWSFEFPKQTEKKQILFGACEEKDQETLAESFGPCLCCEGFTFIFSSRRFA